MRSPRPPLGAALLLLAGGCAHSPATRMLTLDAVAPAPEAVRADYHGPPLAVPAVHLPAVLDRAEFIRSAGAGEIRVDDFARWAAPLGLLARDTLVRDLSARLPQGVMLPPGSVGGPGTRALDVTILSLGTDPGGARLEAAWRILPDGPVRQASVTASGSTAGPPASAQLFSGLVGQLADRIANDLPR